MDHFRGLGYDVQEEFPIGEGKTVDIVTSRNGKRTAVEIETGKSNPAANIAKCIRSGFDRVWSVFTDKNEEESFLAKWKQPAGKERSDIRILRVGQLFGRAQADHH